MEFGGIDGGPLKTSLFQGAQGHPKGCVLPLHHPGINGLDFTMELHWPDERHSRQIKAIVRIRQEKLILLRKIHDTDGSFN